MAGTANGRVYRLGIAGLSHLHAWNTIHHARSRNGICIAGAADVRSGLREQLAEEVDSTIPLFDDPFRMIDRLELDAILCFEDNYEAPDIVEAAAEHGLHVYKEQPMASNLADAERMVAACAAAEVRLMVNWPTAWSPALHKAREIIQCGTIGWVAHARVRAGHSGPPRAHDIRSETSRSGWKAAMNRETGGALLECGSYGAALCCWLMGPPARVAGMAGRFARDYFRVEDNAVLLLGYHHGLAVVEATWSQIGRIPRGGNPVFHGTEGTIAIQTNDELLLATMDQPDGKLVQADPLPEGWESGLDHFIWCLDRDRPASGMCSPECSRDAQEILEAGLQAITTGSEVSLPLKSFLYG